MILPDVTGDAGVDRFARGVKLATCGTWSAMACTHGEGIVLRDIKPEDERLSCDTALVTDFGIAKTIAPTESQTWCTGSVRRR